MRKIGAFLIVSAMALSGLSLALAARPDRGAGPGPGPGMKFERMLGTLDLEASQKEEVLGIVERYHEGPLGEIAETLHQAHRQLGKAIHDPEAGEQQVLEAARVVSARSEQMALERHRMFLEIAGVLTPEQMADLREMIEKHDGPGHHRHGAGPRGPGEGW